jgi:hypothetical protein
LPFVSVSFWAFHGKGSSKTPYKYFSKKSMSRTFFDVSFSSGLRVLSRFRLFRSDWSSNTHKNPKPIFADFFNHVFGRFSVRGVQKHWEVVSIASSAGCSSSSSIFPKEVVKDKEGHEEATFGHRQRGESPASVHRQCASPRVLAEISPFRSDLLRISCSSARMKYAVKTEV